MLPMSTVVRPDPAAREPVTVTAAPPEELEDELLEELEDELLELLEELEDELLEELEDEELLLEQ